MGDPRDETVTFDLRENLEIHQLDVTPKELEQSVEFVLHAEIYGLDESQMQKVTSTRLVMEQLTCSVETVE